MTQEQIQALLYLRSDGWFENLTTRNSRALKGHIAGTFTSQDYVQIQLDGVFYKAHQLVWLYLYGYIPDEMDHKNGIRWDNRPENLREATRSQNNANSERRTGVGGLRGVTWFERDQKWKAQIRIDGRCKHLGYFDTVEQAHVAYLNAADIVHGEYAIHNRDNQRS